MKKIVFILVCYTVPSFCIRGMVTTGHVAAKKHKQQQLKSTRKLLKKGIKPESAPAASQWITLAQRQPKIEKPIKKETYKYKPHITYFDLPFESFARELHESNCEFAITYCYDYGSRLGDRKKMTTAQLLNYLNSIHYYTLEK